MNQENTPQMQPMEQAGNKGQCHILPITRRGLQPKRQRQTLSPPRHRFLPGYDEGHTHSYPAQGQMQPYQACHRHALWRLSTTWIHRTSAQTCPPRCKRQTSTANHRKGNRFRQHGQQPRAAGRSPGIPEATLLDTSNHRLTIRNKRFSSSPQQQTHTLCSQRWRSHYPKRTSNRLRMPTRGEQPFVPSFVEPATYGEDYAHTINGGIIESVEETAPSKASITIT